MSTKTIILSFIISVIFLLPAYSQQQTLFKGTFVSQTDSVTMTIDLYENNITIDGQELLGDVSGYISVDYDFRRWIIVGSQFKNDNEALLTIVNDYGSEDLIATFTYEGEGRYRLKQQQGSTIKFGKNKKWIKLPKNLLFERLE